MASHTPVEAVVSHWSTLIESFQTSPLSFYEALETALKRREIPATKNERVDYREGGAATANREYLRVQRDLLIFDVCAAPFGTGFFVSWWLSEEQSSLHPVVRVLLLLVMLGLAIWLWATTSFFAWLILVSLFLAGVPVALEALVQAGTFSEGAARTIPLVGAIYVWMFRPESYYRMDSTEMFQKAVHNAVLEVIEAMTAEKGLRALSDADRKPVMREFYQKR